MTNGFRYGLVKPRFFNLATMAVTSSSMARIRADRPHPQLFTLARGLASMALVVRVTGAPGHRMEMIRDVVRAVDPKVAVFDARTMERLDYALERPRFHATVVIFFGGIALLLAVIDVNGVAPYSVVQRTREIGIRLRSARPRGPPRNASESVYPAGRGGVGRRCGAGADVLAICRRSSMAPMRHRWLPA